MEREKDLIKDMLDYWSQKKYLEDDKPVETEKKYIFTEI